LSRIDKYEPMGGGFRVPLNAAIAAVDVGKVQGVSLNASGRAVVGGAAAAIGIKGVICPVKAMAAGDIVDVMTDGEIVEFTDTAGGASTAGTDYFAAFATGAVNTTATGSPQYIGHTVEVGRLVVRVGR
jgi:hypothetical protein